MDDSGTKVLELVHETKDSGPVQKWEMYNISPSSEIFKSSMADLKYFQEM